MITFIPEINIIKKCAMNPENWDGANINWDFVSGDLHIDHPEVVEGLDPFQEDDLLSWVASHMGVA